MIPLLRRVEGLRYLRISAAVTAVLFIGFLLVPDVGAKLALVAAIAVVDAGFGTRCCRPASTARWKGRAASS